MILQTPKGPVEIRELQTIDDMLAAEKIQTQVWGDIAVHPKEMLIPIQFEGGLLAGAFTPAAEMIGLVFSFPTRDPAVMHSQMLATVDEWRGLGIGRTLKWFQRDWCLERGFRLLRWTADPLRAANAELNIRQLGARSSSYALDYYGAMQGIDAGTPTDRLLLDWDLVSERVKSRSQRPPEDRGFPTAEIANELNGEVLSDIRLGLDGKCILIRLPKDFVRLSQTQPGLAREWRMQTRDLFQHYFARGYAIREFTRVGGAAYLLEAGDPIHEP
jgi:chorismate synthase